MNFDLIEDKKKRNIICFYNTKMSKNTLKFGNAVVNKNEFHAYKKQIVLNLIDTDKTIISDKFKHNGKGSK